MTRHARAWRSLMFVPGGRSDMVSKTPRWRPDAIVVDQEDAVATDDKDHARAALGHAGRADARLVGGIETAAGVATARALLAAGLSAAYFGAEDYEAHVTMARSVLGRVGESG